MAQHNCSINDLTFQGPSELVAISKKLANPFWCDAIRVASDIIKSISYAQPNKIMLYPIFRNPLFKIGNRSIDSNAIAGNNGNIKQIADFFAVGTRQLYNCDEFNLMHGVG